MLDMRTVQFLSNSRRMVQEGMTSSKFTLVGIIRIT